MAFIGATQSTVSSTTVTGNAPALAGKGHIGYAFLTTVNTEVVTTPPGWAIYDSGVQGNLQWILYRRVITKAGTSVTITGDSSGKKTLIFAAVSKVDTTDPESSDSPAAEGTNTASSTRPIPSGTATDYRQALSFVGSRGNLAPTVWTQPGGWTFGAGGYNTGSGATTGAVAYRTYTAGAVGGDNWTSDTSELRGVATLTLFVEADPPAKIDFAGYDLLLGQRGTEDFWDFGDTTTVIMDGEWFAEPVVPVYEIIKYWDGTDVISVQIHGTWDGTTLNAVETQGVWDGTALNPVETT